MSKVTVVNINTLGKLIGLKKEMIYFYLSSRSKDIDACNVDFSGITVVLGKNGGNSSKIVDNVSSKLDVLGINYYISDIDKLTPAILRQAALENPSDKIMAIRVGGETNFLEGISIVNDTHNSPESKSQCKNSDSLALIMNSSISESIIVSGKRDTNSKYPLRINTDLARFINNNKFTNPMVKNVTISIPDNLNLDFNRVSDDIVCGIVRFCCLSDEAKNQSYLVTKENDFGGQLVAVGEKPLECSLKVTLPKTKEKIY